MAAAVDAANIQFFTAAANTSYSNNSSFLCPVADNGIVCFMMFEVNPGTITAPTWNAVSFTPIGSIFSNAANTVWIAAFGMIAPSTSNVTHFTFAVSWANSSAFGVSFIPMSGVDQTAIATSFINRATNTGTDATTANGVTIVDASPAPTSNIDIADFGCAGGSVTLTTGQTAVGQQIGATDTWNIGYGAGSASQNFTFHGSVAGRAWAEVGLTAVAIGNLPGPAGDTISIPFRTSFG